MDQHVKIQVDEERSERLERRRQQSVVQGILSEQLLDRQNKHFDGTGGVSANNREMGFVPAFQDMESGVSVVSRFADGRPAPVHVLDGLPEEWITARDAEGCVVSVRNTVIAGFISNDRFYTREEAATERKNRRP